MKSHLVATGLDPAGFAWKGGETIDRHTRALVEAVVGAPNFKEIWWLQMATDAARHVARVKLPFGSATGFLISEDILMTNHHVFEDEDDAAQARLQFNYQLKADGDAAAIDTWRCDPETLFHTNPALDYSIVKVKAKEGQRAGEVWDFFDLRHGERVYEGNRVNIIQHPQGRFKEIAFRDNQVKFIGDDVLQYLTDTDYGSSGSPVLDDWFRVVALHNQRVPDPADPNRWHRNQGFRVEAILADAEGLIP